MAAHLIFIAACALSACRPLPDRPGAGDDTTDAPPPDAPPPDGPDGVGCTPTTPRAVAPEVFVGPTGLEDRLAALIDGAQHKLFLQMYLFDDLTLGDHLVSAAARGVEVRVLLDPNEGGNGPVRQLLGQHQIPVRNAPSIYAYSHAKYMILDGTTGVVMSMNFNDGAMTEERNYGFVDGDDEDVADLERIYTMDWAAAGGQTPRPANLECTRLVVSPDNSAARVVAFINGATHTLDVEAMYITDSHVSTAVVQAALRGVTVRVILEDPNQQSGNGDIARLFGENSIPVQFAVAQFFLHAKLMIADGVAFVGSENYSPTSLTMNREVGGLIFEPGAEAVIQAQFEADWVSTGPGGGSGSGSGSGSG